MKKRSLYLAVAGMLSLPVGMAFSAELISSNTEELTQNIPLLPYHKHYVIWVKETITKTVENYDDGAVIEHTNASQTVIDKNGVVQLNHVSEEWVLQNYQITKTYDGQGGFENEVAWQYDYDADGVFAFEGQSYSVGNVVVSNGITTESFRTLIDETNSWAEGFRYSGTAEQQYDRLDLKSILTSGDYTGVDSVQDFVVTISDSVVDGIRTETIKENMHIDWLVASDGTLGEDYDPYFEVRTFIKTFDASSGEQLSYEVLIDGDWGSNGSINNHRKVQVDGVIGSESISSIQEEYAFARWPNPYDHLVEEYSDYNWGKWNAVGPIFNEKTFTHTFNGGLWSTDANGQRTVLDQSTAMPALHSQTNEPLVFQTWSSSLVELSSSQRREKVQWQHIAIDDDEGNLAFNAWGGNFTYSDIGQEVKLMTDSVNGFYTTEVFAEYGSIDLDLEGLIYPQLEAGLSASQISALYPELYFGVSTNDSFVYHQDTQQARVWYLVGPVFNELDQVTSFDVLTMQFANGYEGLQIGLTEPSYGGSLFFRTACDDTNPDYCFWEKSPHAFGAFDVDVDKGYFAASLMWQSWATNLANDQPWINYPWPYRIVEFYLNNEEATARAQQLSQALTNADVDGDGMLDQWEWQVGLNAYDASDAEQDNDYDGLTNKQEYELGSSIELVDTDGDGVSDYDEYIAGTDPTLPPSSLPAKHAVVSSIGDIDGNGVENIAVAYNRDNEVLICEGSCEFGHLVMFPKNLTDSQYIWLDDRSGDGVKELALFGYDSENNRYQLVVKDPLTTDLLGTWNWPKAHDEVSFIELKDLNQDGLNEYGLFGVHQVNGTRQLLVKDGATRRTLSTFKWPDLWDNTKIVMMDDVTGDTIPEVALYGVHRRLGKGQLFVKDGSDASKLDVYNWNKLWNENQLLAMDDLDGEGTHDWGQFGQRKDDGRYQVVVKKGHSKKGAIRTFSWAANFDATTATPLLLKDRTGDGVREIAVAGLDTNDGKMKLFINDGALANQRLYNIAWPANWDNAQIVELGDLNQDGFAELGMLGYRKSDGAVQLVIKDGEDFSEYQRFIWTQQLKELAVSSRDLDHDGVDEIVLTGFSSVDNSAFYSVRSLTQPNALNLEKYFY